jgi:hypothetical protein
MSATVRTDEDHDQPGTLYRFQSQVCMGREKPQGLTPAEEASWESIKSDVAMAKQSGWAVDCPNTE